MIAKFFLLTLILPSVSLAQLSIDRDANGNILKESYPNNLSVIYKYDSAGNRIITIVSESACPGDISTFYAGKSTLANTYQWQADTGTGYINIVDDAVYNGTQSPFLKLNNPPTHWYGRKYRCLMNGSELSEELILKFELVWTGTISIAWEDPGNWSCNIIPDEFTDVIINGDVLFKPVVNSAAFARSVTLGPTAHLLINPSFSLKVTK